jgi:hypothetical protein
MQEEVLDELQNRFTYHKPKEGQDQLYKAIRNMGLVMASMIREFCPDTYESSLAITKVEEAVMWSNASIARHG